MQNNMSQSNTSTSLLTNPVYVQQMKILNDNLELMQGEERLRQQRERNRQQVVPEQQRVAQEPSPSIAPIPRDTANKGVRKRKGAPSANKESLQPGEVAGKSSASKLGKVKKPKSVETSAPRKVGRRTSKRTFIRPDPDTWKRATLAQYSKARSYFRLDSIDDAIRKERFKMLNASRNGIKNGNEKEKIGNEKEKIGNEKDKSGDEKDKIRDEKKKSGNENGAGDASLSVQVDASTGQLAKHDAPSQADPLFRSEILPGVELFPPPSINVQSKEVQAVQTKRSETEHSVENQGGAKKTALLCPICSYRMEFVNGESQKEQFKVYRHHFHFANHGLKYRLRGPKTQPIPEDEAYFCEHDGCERAFRSYRQRSSP